MKTEYILHKLPEGFIITSDEEIKKGDNVIDNVGRIWINMEDCFIKAVKESRYGKSYKIIAQQDQIDFSNLTEEEQEEIGWFDVEKLDENHGKIFSLEGGHRNYAAQGYLQGFKKSQELLSDKQFTLDDMENAFYNGWNYRGEGYDFPKAKKEYLQYLSLSQPKSWKIEIEHTCNGIRKEGESCTLNNKCTYPNCGKIKILKLC
jgi:hypothetical protein